ncbi:hypothetical protein PILCRDRAFT_16601 [Piloderma croceum F 1598]|uniref:Uncharacterized protein n=1 Tax=Piloderma croceum (strain F 1598) TaxID=765440 RepID=A0A0C3ADN8_PILCF|nr:hypothetical protein PILCRDRAFT_16601 [Piloderma croceum F 1598]
MDGIPGDDDFGDDGTRNGDLEDPDDEPPNDDEGPDDQHDNSNDSNHDMQHNLADAIAALARNVQHQGDSPHSKFQEPNPFNVNFAILYLKGIALAHFVNLLIELDLPTWGDDYREFILELKTYFRPLWTWSVKPKVNLKTYP